MLIHPLTQQRDLRQQAEHQLDRRLTARSRDPLRIRNPHERMIPCTSKESSQSPRPRVNAYLGATVISGRLKESLVRLNDVHTFGGHATSAAAALEAIRIYETEKLPERSHALGEALLARLRELSRYDSVGDVRGMGLWMAVDFTSDRRTKAPLSKEKLRDIVMQARHNGVLVSRNGTAIEIAPPYTIDEDEAFEGIARFERAIAAVVE